MLILIYVHNIENSEKNISTMLNLLLNIYEKIVEMGSKA